MPKHHFTANTSKNVLSTHWKNAIILLNKIAVYMERTAEYKLCRELKNVSYHII